MQQEDMGNRRELFLGEYKSQTMKGKGKEIKEKPKEQAKLHRCREKKNIAKCMTDPIMPLLLSMPVPTHAVAPAGDFVIRERGRKSCVKSRVKLLTP